MNNKNITQHNERIKKENVQSIFILKDNNDSILTKVYCLDEAEFNEYQILNIPVIISSIMPDKYLHFSVTYKDSRLRYSCGNAEVYVRADTLVYFHINKHVDDSETLISILFQNKGCSGIGIYECAKFKYDLNSTADYNELSPDIRANIMELIV